MLIEVLQLRLHLQETPPHCYSRDQCVVKEMQGVVHNMGDAGAGMEEPSVPCSSRRGMQPTEKSRCSDDTAECRSTDDASSGSSSNSSCLESPCEREKASAARPEGV